jgi:hypothetical protein
MRGTRRVLGYLQRVSCKLKLNKALAGEARIVASGWDEYATKWNPAEFRVLPGYHVRYLGDEWTAEDVSAGGTTYGLTPDVIANFDDYIDKYLLNPYLPSGATEGLEIGPAGGRLTVLLVSRTKVLHLAEPSTAMLQHLTDPAINS